MPPHGTATITRWYVLCPAGRNPSSRSIRRRFASYAGTSGRQVALRVGEGNQLSMDQIPAPGRASEARRADLLLPAGIGQWIGGAPGQDQGWIARRYGR